MIEIQREACLHEAQVFAAQVLGVEKNASADDIRKAYKKKALETHPDKGGDEDEFKRAAKAYEVLSDANQRRHG